MSKSLKQQIHEKEEEIKKLKKQLEEEERRKAINHDTIVNLGCLIDGIKKGKIKVKDTMISSTYFGMNFKTRCDENDKN